MGAYIGPQRLRRPGLGQKIYDARSERSYTSGMKHSTVGLTFLVLFGALVLAVGCSSSNGKLASSGDATQIPFSDSATLPAGHPTVAPGARELPVEALLGEADLGSAWAQGSHESDPLSPSDSYYCGKKVKSLPWTHVAQFANDENGNFLLQVLAKFPDEAAAKAALQEERDATANCGTWSSSTGADKVEWRIESVKQLDFGDEAFVEKSSTQAGDPPQRAVDVAVLVRKGDVVILLDEGGSRDISSDETSGFARSAYDKLVKALEMGSPTPNP
jgi:hypothetical protein